MQKPKQRYQELNISGFRERQIHRHIDRQRKTDTQTNRQTEKD